MRKVARLIITEKYDANVPGENLNHEEVRNKTTEIMAYKNDIFENLKEYEEIVITGGDPFVVPERTLRNLVKELKRQDKKRKISICTTCLRADEYGKILNLIDGITVIVRPGVTDDDICDLKYMSENLYGAMLDLKLLIDKSIYKKYDLRNTSMSTWDVVRKIKWETGYELKSKDDLFNFLLV